MLPKITSTSITREDLKILSEFMEKKKIRTRYDAVHHIMEFARVHGGLS